jgi:hypothetical protein
LAVPAGLEPCTLLILDFGFWIGILFIRL